MSETIFQDGNAQVTRTIAVIGNISYPINGITAVYVSRKKLSIGQILFGACAAIAGVALLSDTALQFLFLAGGAFLILAAFRRPYWLMLRTASGDTQALENTDGAYLHRIREAIVEAVASRG